MKELIAHAKSRPGALSYGSQGMGTTGHIGWERFNLMAGVNILHVPYKGAAPGRDARHPRQPARASV